MGADEVYQLALTLLSRARVEGMRLMLDEEAEEALDRLRDLIVSLAVDEEELEEAVRWTGILLGELSRASTLIGAQGWSFPRELRSFLADPRGHLRKKLFNYVFDLARGRIGVDELVRRGEAAVRTSLRTNLRSIYQDWVFAAVLTGLGERGGRLVYPETGVVLLERSGRQRSGSIPPNAIIRLPRGEVSFFLEAPRPLGWEDSGDLERTWKLYVALRPDMLVYSGRVLDIVAPDRDPPVLAPDLIVECKELPDWYERSRDLRGPLAKPLRALEWRARWLRGLEEGLADILGVDRGRLRDFTMGRARSVRVREHRLLLLYKETFQPREFVLVSRSRLPGEIRGDLEEHGILVLDGVEIGDRRGLQPLVDLVEGLAAPAGPGGGMEEAVRAALARALREGLDPVLEAGRAALEYLASRGDPLASRLLGRGSS